MTCHAEYIDQRLGEWLNKFCSTYIPTYIYTIWYTCAYIYSLAKYHRQNKNTWWNRPVNAAVLGSNGVIAEFWYDVSFLSVYIRYFCQLHIWSFLVSTKHRGNTPVDIAEKTNIRSYLRFVIFGVTHRKFPTYQLRILRWHQKGGSMGWSRCSMLRKNTVPDVPC